MNASYTLIIISGEAVSLAVVLVVLYGLFFEHHDSGKRHYYFTWTAIACAFSLVTDMLARILDGREGIHGLQMMINCCSLIAASLIVSFFSHYQIAMLKRKDSGISQRYALPVVAINLIAILVTIAATITGHTFTVVDNVFMEGPLYHLCTYATLVSMLYMLFISIIFRKALGSHEAVAFFIYQSIPIVTAFIQLFMPYLEIAYITVSIAVLIVYIMLQSGHISELGMREKIMEEISLKDSLTGLQNRRAFDRMIEESLSWEKAGVIFGDLNGLKFFNDTLGHKSGDTRLKECAALFMQFFPRENIFRVSGDEFVIIQKKTGPEFEKTAKDLRQALLDTKDLASIGYAQGEGFRIKLILREAEEAMYEEKKQTMLRHPEYYRR